MSDTVCIDQWLEKIKLIEFRDFHAARTPEIENFFSRLWPVADEYYSPLNPAFLIDMKNVETWSDDRPWLVRDGLIPLLWFFKTNPSPGNFKGQLLIHEQWESWIPEAWKKNTGIYGYVSEKKIYPPEELLLLGQISPSYCRIEALERDLEALAKAYGGKKGLSKLRISLFLPARYEEIDTYAGPAFYNRYMITLCKVLGTDLQALEYEQLQTYTPRGGMVLHEFNEKLLVSDSYLTRVALKKGGTQALSRSPGHVAGKKWDRLVPLYPGVSFGIRNKVSEKKSNPILQERISWDVIQSPAQLNFPWDRWFSDWVLSQRK